MTQKESQQLFELVRDSSKLETEIAQRQNDQAILWAVRYHVALYFAGISTGDSVLYNILLAANTMQDKNLVQRLGLDNVSSICEQAMKSDYNGKIAVVKQPKEGE